MKILNPPLKLNNSIRYGVILLPKQFFIFPTIEVVTVQWEGVNRRTKELFKRRMKSIVRGIELDLQRLFVVTN